MPHGIETVFISPRVQRGDIEVMDLFTVDDHMIEFDGVGMSPEERVSGLEPGHEAERVHEGAHKVVSFLLFFPHALPHDADSVAHGGQSYFFASGGFVDVTHGLVVHLVTLFVTVRVTLGTPVPKATVEFVHDTIVDIVPVHVEGFLALTNHVFCSIGSVTNVTTGDVIQVGQPFQGCVGIQFALPVLTTDEFGGQLTFWRVFGAVEEIARGGDGDTAFEGLKPLY